MILITNFPFLTDSVKPSHSLNGQNLLSCDKSFLSMFPNITLVLTFMNRKKCYYVQTAKVVNSKDDTC